MLQHRCTHLNLLYCEIQECEIAAHRDHRLGAVAAHRGPETTIQLHYHELVQHNVCLVCGRLGERAVVPHLQDKVQCVCQANH